MILVVNFGSQLAHLIARRVRELGVFSEIAPFDISADKIKAMSPDGVILSGGPSSVYEKGAPLLDPEVFSLEIPLLGICYGAQLIGRQFGIVKNRPVKEFGHATLKIIKPASKLFRGLADSESVWMSHGDAITGLGRGFEVVASTADCAIAAVENDKMRIYGVQFHPEVAHTVHGKEMLANFVFGVCKAKEDFGIADMRKKIVDEIKETVGGDSVLMGVSGGVDSTVAASLLHEAIGDRLHCVFIDQGLMRKGEKEEVDSAYAKHCGFENYYSVDASKIFLSRLLGVSDPEEKRKIIGHTFVEVFEDKAKGLAAMYPRIKFLGQGTIYPDRIESAQPSKGASKIKSHHNLALPEKMDLKVIEPLKELYKDDVRRLGAEINVPQELLGRHPFPGPGLAIRVIGDVSKEKLDILREADAIFISELKSSGYYGKVWQAFAALLPIRTVGVMGDARTYDFMVALRAVDSVDAMTADWSRLPQELLEKISARIVNEVRGVNRVVYDITQKPPATIEYE